MDVRISTHHSLAYGVSVVGYGLAIACCDTDSDIDYGADDLFYNRAMGDKTLISTSLKMLQACGE